MGKRKEFTGIVISDKMQKTVIVRTMRLAKDRKYHRVVKRYDKFKAHNQEGIAKIGDTVLIEETRPLSKDKRFRVVRVVKQAVIPHVEIKEETA